MYNPHSLFLKQTELTGRTKHTMSNNIKAEVPLLLVEISTVIG